MQFFDAQNSEYWYDFSAKTKHSDAGRHQLPPDSPLLSTPFSFSATPSTPAAAAEALQLKREADTARREALLAEETAAAKTAELEQVRAELETAKAKASKTPKTDPKADELAKEIHNKQQAEHAKQTELLAAKEIEITLLQKGQEAAQAGRIKEQADLKQAQGALKRKKEQVLEQSAQLQEQAEALSRAQVKNIHIRRSLL